MDGDHFDPLSKIKDGPRNAQTRPRVNLKNNIIGFLAAKAQLNTCTCLASVCLSVCPSVCLKPETL